MDEDLAERIWQLRMEAAEARDRAQVALCDAALDGDLEATERCRAVLAYDQAIERGESVEQAERAYDQEVKS
jgi:hypothetical protein